MNEIKTPNRQMHRFWLSNKKETEKAVNAMIPVLKEQRRFTAAVRDGLRLIIALTSAEQAIQSGVGQPQQHIQILRLLFPNVVRHIEQSAANQELVALRAQLETLGQQVAAGSMPAPIEKPRAAAMPETLKVETAAADGSKVAANLLKSFKLMQQ